MSTIVTLTSRKQITFSKDILEHLGVKGGDQVFARKMPGGKIWIEAQPGKEGAGELFNIFDEKSKTDKNLVSRKSASLDSRLRGNDDGK